MATLRLVAAAGLNNGAYDAGVDIAMAPGSHTYWKMPGEAGVPPVFAFNGSENVASATVQFPSPTRLSEDGIDAFGYTDRVTFPVVVRPADPAKPAVLKVDATYAVCNKICVPAHGTASLELAPKGAASDDGAVAAALARVPAALPTADADKLTLAPIPGAPKPSWTVTWSGTPALTDVFADAPEGFFFDTAKLGPDRWRLVAAQVVSADGKAEVPVSLTLAKAGGGAFAVTRTLDAARPKK